MIASTTASEWAQVASLSVGLYAAVSAPYFLLVEADYLAWPRPVTAAVDRVKPVLRQPTVHAGHDLNWALASGQHYAREFATDVRSYARLSLRDTAFTAAALYALLTITPGDAR